MKGLVEHLIMSNAQLERELERDLKKIEVPYMSDAYSDWLVNVDGKTANAAASYVSYLRSMDNELFVAEDDFFESLRDCLKGNDLRALEALFDRYAGILDEWLEYSRKEDIGISSRTISDWRSAFRSYRKFMTELCRHNAAGADGRIAYNASSQYTDVLTAGPFFKWLVRKGFTEGSANSYISRLKRVDREVFCRYGLKASLFRMIIDLLHKSENGKVLDLLYYSDNVLSGLIDNRDSSFMDIAEMSNCRSALRSYIQFIQEELFTDLPEEEETDRAVWHYPSSCSFDMDILKKNFWWRLVTQDRMGNNKDVFYPIRLLRRLFRVTGEYQWFNDLIYASIAGIRIMTDQGEVLFSDLNGTDTLSIDAVSGTVSVTLGDGRRVCVLTQTDVSGAAPVPMKAVSLNEIHIDHSPLISDILSDNRDRLPALTALTDMIKDVAGRNRLNIVSGNFTRINGLVMDSCFEGMKKMIPELKKELEMIGQLAVLRLMSASFNLKKK